jgi:hypothetical protein
MITELTRLQRIFEFWATEVQRLKDLPNGSFREFRRACANRRRTCDDYAAALNAK